MCGCVLRLFTSTVSVASYFVRTTADTTTHNTQTKSCIIYIPTYIQMRTRTKRRHHPKTQKTPLRSSTSALRRLETDFPFPSLKPAVTPNMHGWLGDGNQLLLQKFIQKDTRIIFEFGTWLGKSAMYMLQLQAVHPEFTTIVCVDTWEGDWSIKQTDKYKKHMETLYDTFIVNMWDHKEKVVPLRMDGRKAMKYLHDIGLKPDLIYLDMDHSYESAKGDLECLMKYFPDTIILGDDVLYWKGVAKAVKEIVKEYHIPNLEINKNCYALVPSHYNKQYRLKELVTRVIQPTEQYIDYKIGIIVGYHSQFHTTNQLERLRTYMKLFMEKARIDYKIYVIDQRDHGRELNLGHLYNVGYEIALADGCAKFVFQDLFLLPSPALAPYYRRDTKHPIHLGYHYDTYYYEMYYLGIIMFNKEHFELLNGYPINIYGLYGWDYEMVLRIKDVGLTLKIPESGAVIPNRTHPRINVQEWKKIKTSAIINRHSETWKTNGLRNTYYTRVRDTPETRKISRNSQLCEVYGVSISKYTDYLVNQQNLEYTFTDTPACIKDLEFESGVPTKELQYGYIQNKDKPFVNDVELLDQTFAYEYALVNQHAYSTQWKQSATPTTMNTPQQVGIFQTYDMYKLNMLLHSKNTFNHITTTFDVFFQWGAVVGATAAVANILEVTKIHNVLRYYCKERDIPLKTINANIDLIGKRNPTLSHSAERQLKEFEQRFAHTHTYDLCVPCRLYPYSAYTLDTLTLDLFQHVTVALLYTKRKGTAILKTRGYELFTRTFYELMCVLRNKFNTVNLFFSKFQSAQQNMVFVICDGFHGCSENEKHHLIQKCKYVITHPKTSVTEVNQHMPSPSYIAFIHKFQYNQYSQLEKVERFRNLPTKDKNALLKKLHYHKIILKNALISDMNLYE